MTTSSTPGPAPLYQGLVAGRAMALFALDHPYFAVRVGDFSLMCRLKEGAPRGFKLLTPLPPELEGTELPREIQAALIHCGWIKRPEPTEPAWVTLTRLHPRLAQVMLEYIEQHDLEERAPLAQSLASLCTAMAEDFQKRLAFQKRRAFERARGRRGVPAPSPKQEPAAPQASPAPDTGFDKAPDRYMTQGRETVDRMRDLCRKRALEWQADLGPDSIELIDLLFVVACETHKMKYSDRKGVKEGVDPKRDIDAAAWWEQMAKHVQDPARFPDPRYTRVNFIPYSPVEVP